MDSSHEILSFFQDLEEERTADVRIVFSRRTERATGRHGLSLGPWSYCECCFVVRKSSHTEIYSRASCTSSSSKEAGSECSQDFRGVEVGTTEYSLPILLRWNWAVRQISFTETRALIFLAYSDSSKKLYWFDISKRHTIWSRILAGCFRP